MAQYQQGTPQVTVQQPGVAAQPGQMVWMQPPAAPMGCPPGLEYLTQIDQLLIRQQVELFELFTGCEMKNKYQICNSLGQQIYFAQEDTDCCTRYWCGPARPFEMQITDNAGREVVHLSRPLRCDCCCCPCCLQTIEVQSPPGTVVGYVEQEWYICKPKFTIKDANEQVVLTMTGPICACRCCSDVEFPVNSADGTVPVGKVTKQWTGLIREAFTDADNFGITFPMDLDVKMKAVMLGACFLIDFMFFEHQQNNN